jgi:P4 family phage/plasmid primase-like protien
MVSDLAQDLGVTARSLTTLGIGWIPGEACWVFPERDGEGRIVGLVRRFKDGKKLSMPGSKRGLTYAVSGTWKPTGKTYVPGSQNWIRTSEDYPCPICGKHDWCLVSSEDPADPQAVICGRKAEGAIQPLGESGYLHIRKESGDVCSSGNVLCASSLPVLVVEGQSDVAAAYDLGFVAVGKPSAASGLTVLSSLLSGRDVVVLGENDAGAGRLGMEKTFETLKPKAKTLTKLMPPETIKDLRAWVRAGLTSDDLRAAITNNGVSTSSGELLESIAPIDLADRWLHERHWLADLPVLRTQAGTWYRFDGTKYAEIDPKTMIRGDLYTFLNHKTFKKTSTTGEVTVAPYDADAHRVNNIVDALTMTCPVTAHAPCWLDEEEHPCPQDLVNFNNCLVNVRDTSRGLNLSPLYFSLNALPYPWSPTAEAPTWRKFLQEIFPNDQEKVLLLQEWFGYNMVADTSYEKLMFFVGRPGAGKGTVLEALRAVLGSSQVASTSFDSLVGDFGLQPLCGKLSAILSDAHITRRGDPAKALQVLKEISGRDGVGINRKNKEFLSDYKLSCRFTISVNAMPDLPDHERALDRRLLLLHFGESFAGREDITLKERIVAEAPGIAVWALDGLRRLRARGFTSPTSSIPVIEDFRKQSSPITEFADENCAFDGKNFIPSNMLYDAYAHWCKDQGAMAGTHLRFSQRFLMMYPGCRADRVPFNKKQTRCFVGVTLTEEAAERYLLRR